MTVWEDGLVIPRVAETHLLFADLLLELRRLDVVQRRKGFSGQAATIAEVQAANVRFNAKLNELALATAKTAQSEMRRLFERTRKRPNGGVKDPQHRIKPNLVARPVRSFGRVGTGMVGIADTGRLDRVTNPFAQTAKGKVPYWRTQEYGFQHSHSVRGFFFDRGLANPTRPGAGTGQPIFLSARSAAAVGASVGVATRGGAQGGGGGLMTIVKPIEARNFISGAANNVYPAWKSALEAIETGTAAEINAALGVSRASGGRRRRS